MKKEKLSWSLQRLISTVDQIKMLNPIVAPKFANKIEIFFDGETVLEFFSKSNFLHHNPRII